MGASASQDKALDLTGERLTWIALGGIVALHLIFAYLVFDPKPFIGGDNAAYMGLAESLRTGEGYRDLYLPGAPRHAQYPPLYPGLLAIVGGLGGGIIAFKVLSVLLTAAAVVFTFCLARSRYGIGSAYAVALPLSLSPVLLYYSHWVLSEAPFVALTLGALWAAERAEDSTRWGILALLLACLAYLTRAAGLPLLVAFIAVLAWRRQWVKLAWSAGAIAPVVIGWWLWGRMAASDSAARYESNFLLVNPYAPEQGYVGPGDILVRAVENLRRYAVEVTPQSLAGAGEGVAGGGPLLIGLLALLTSLLILALAIVAWARAAREPRVLEGFAFFYLGLIAIWPQVWTDQRFLLPLLPVLLIYTMGGIIWSFEFMKVERPMWVFGVVAALLSLLAVPDDVSTALGNRACMRLYRQGDSLACYPPAWRAFVQAGEWVGENTPEDAIVITRKPRLFYYFARRQGDVYPFTSDDREMITWLEGMGADYVVVAGLSGTTMRYLVPVIRSQQERFALVHQIGDRSASAYILAYRGLGPGHGGQ